MDDLTPIRVRLPSLWLTLRPIPRPPPLVCDRHNPDSFLQFKEEDRVRESPHQVFAHTLISIGRERLRTPLDPPDGPLHR